MVLTTRDIVEVYNVFYDHLTEEEDTRPDPLVVAVLVAALVVARVLRGDSGWG